jgi:uncharacterized Fe-S cluster-containing radical SAM superfamily protein
MTSEVVITAVMAAAVGYGVGWMSCWRFSCKLESLQVRLWQWNQPFDIHARLETAAKVVHRMERP